MYPSSCPGADGASLAGNGMNDHIASRGHDSTRALIDDVTHDHTFAAQLWLTRPHETHSTCTSVHEHKMASIKSMGQAEIFGANTLSSAVIASHDDRGAGSHACGQNSFSTLERPACSAGATYVTSASKEQRSASTEELRSVCGASAPHTASSCQRAFRTKTARPCARRSWNTCHWTPYSLWHLWSARRRHLPAGTACEL